MRCVRGKYVEGRDAIARPRIVRFGVVGGHDAVARGLTLRGVGAWVAG